MNNHIFRIPAHLGFFGWSVLLLAMSLPSGATPAQNLPVSVRNPAPGITHDAGEIPLLGHRVSVVSLRTRAMELAQQAVLSSMVEEKIPLFSEAEERARAALKDGPDDLGSLYVLAVTLGLRIDYVGPWAKVRMGEEILRTVQKILELDPSHAGDQHIMGRLHSGAMSLSSVTRFVAHRLLDSSSQAFRQVRRAVAAYSMASPRLSVRARSV